MSAPYMPLFVGDYIADTAHLSTAEHGAYLLLIMTYWQRGRPLPDDNQKLARIARMSEAEWSEARATIGEFFEIVDGEWRHRRVDREIAVAAEKSVKARAAARASANVRSASAQRPLSERSTDAATDAEPSQTRPEYRPPAPDAGAQEPALATSFEAECREALGDKAPPLRSSRDSDFAMLGGFDPEDVIAACRDWACDPTARSLQRWKPLVGWARSAKDSRLATSAKIASAARAGQRGPPVRPAKVTVFTAMLEKARSEASG